MPSDGGATDTDRADTDEDTGSTGATVATDGGTEPDVPPDLECPASLGEVVACECATVDGCRVDEEIATSCSVVCDVPSPCPSIECTYTDLAFPECASLEDGGAEALDCVFEALASGQPVSYGVSLSASSPYWGEDTSVRTYRLGETQYLHRSSYSLKTDTENNQSSWALFGSSFEDETWIACADLASNNARAECLYGLRNEGDACMQWDELPCPL